jgi:hypothetical protein
MSPYYKDLIVLELYKFFIEHPLQDCIHATFKMQMQVEGEGVFRPKSVATKQKQQLNLQIKKYIVREFSCIDNMIKFICITLHTYNYY